METMDLSKDFCFGIEFFRYPGPSIEELDKDMRLFWENGIRCIRVQTNWAYEEPLEEQYDFSSIENILIRARAIGMRVIVTVCLENAPTWLFAEYDVYQADSMGNTVRHSLPYPIPGDGKPGPCFDNPIAVEKAQRYAKELITRLGAYPEIIGWAVWQEARSVAGSPVAEGHSLCWCEHTRLAFIKWLKQRYAALDVANRALRTNYGDWAHILPPYIYYKGMEQCPLYMEYAHFLRERTGRIARWKKTLVRQWDPHNRPVMCHTVLAMVEAGIGGQWADEYTVAEEMDMFGVSSYPKWGTRPYLHDEDVLALMLSLDAARCAARGKPVWAAELQFGRPGTLLQRSVMPTGRDIENWIFTALARNAKGIIGWSYRDETFCLESYSHGLLDQNGKPHEWFDAVSGIAGFLERNRKFFASAAIPASRVGILINADNYLLAHMAGEESLAVNSAKGIYFALAEKGIFADFVWKEQLSRQVLAQYDTLFMPCPLSVSRETAALLTEYTASGGHLVAEACLASYTPLSGAESRCMAHGLDSLFGCEEDVLYETEDPAVAQMPLCDVQGRVVAPVHLIQTLRCMTAEPFLWCGDKVVGARNRYGGGKTTLVGTFMSADPANNLLIQDCAGQNLREDTQLADGIWMQRLETAQNHALVLYNRGTDRTKLTLENEGTLCDHHGGTVRQTGETVSVTLEGKSSACLVFTAGHTL